MTAARILSTAEERALVYSRAAALFAGPTRRWETPGALATETTPGTVRTPALDLIDQALVEVLDTPDGRLIITMSPQEGKSKRVAEDFVVWCLTQNPELRVVVASYGQALAVRNGRAIRRAIPKVGLSIARDNGAVHDWTLEGHRGGVYSIGIGGGLTGRPADLMVIDDPIKDPKEADSETFRENNWDWWRSVASTRLAPGAPVVLILTRWHEDDLAGRLLAAEGSRWRVLNIPAQADHDPSKGQVDVLGREPGEYMISARGRTVEQWEQIKVDKGARFWQAMYQGRPAPAEGILFKRDNWRRYTEAQWTEMPDGRHLVPLADGDEICQAWDMSFKGGDSSDFVVGTVWLRRGVQAWLLDMVRRRMTFTETLAAVKALSARWPQASAKYVEEAANGAAIIDMLSRSVGGLIPDNPKSSKVARAQAIAPFQEARNVWLPSAALLPNVEELVEEAASFPNAAHDDAVDSMSLGLNRLLLAPLLLGDDLFEDPEHDDAYSYLRPAY